jgi:hypothetical protein
MLKEILPTFGCFSRQSPVVVAELVEVFCDVAASYAEKERDIFAAFLCYFLGILTKI